MPGQERAAAIIRAAASQPTDLRMQVYRKPPRTVRQPVLPAQVRLEPDAASRGRVGSHSDRTAFAGRGLPQTVVRDRTEEAVGALPDDLDAELPYG
ncbi:hypothetical protein OG601_45675 [Streptomyces sp. NBC_01239]|uniref:hypothetical protein n=1 Tax=Streptomyces sp. NBC_01239 TaxID=2903792 RepID=UPI002250F713|nr:hypothetical protein [Streptomyces sp. NBC_01239]MCX4817888.1 hypothetical protein [Streptomyces sp. NBC_01239]